MKFKITFLPEGREDQSKTIEVDSASPPHGRAGKPGSLLDYALNQAKIDIEHTCGGVAACSTCHVIVEKGLSSCSDAEDDELDQLDNAPGLTLHSRLSCQCVPNGKEDVTVKIPDWNRNMAKETPH